MKKILFLCTGNSCRSQMAEAWARHLHSHQVQAYSAGIETHGLNPNAVLVMREVGVEMAGHTSKHVQSLHPMEFDVVFTVCSHAQDHCPIWLGKGKVIHMGFDDPPKLAAGCTNKEDGLNHYRRVRDEIQVFVKNIFNYLEA